MEQPPLDTERIRTFLDRHLRARTPNGKTLISELYRTVDMEARHRYPGIDHKTLIQLCEARLLVEHSACTSCKRPLHELIIFDDLKSIDNHKCPYCDQFIRPNWHALKEQHSDWAQVYYFDTCESPGRHQDGHGASLKLEDVDLSVLSEPEPPKRDQTAKFGKVF